MNANIWEAQNNTLFDEQSGKGALSNGYLKSDFQEWMKKQKKQDGRPYSPNTIYHYYTDALKNTTAKLELDGSVRLDLFGYTSLLDFKNARKKIFAAKNFEEVNQGTEGGFSAAMKLYARFLKDKERGEKPAGDDDIPQVDAPIMEDGVGKRRYWLYSPGENARLWGEFSEAGMMGIGWAALGDLAQYNSKADVEAAMKQKYDSTKFYTNDVLTVWQFAHEIAVGDIVFAKRGRTTVVGRGVVESEYIFDETRNEYKNIRKVNWTQKGEWEHPGQAVMKTLTDITRDTDYVEKLEALLLGDGGTPDVDDEPEITYPNYSEDDFLGEVFISQEKYVDLKGLLLRKKNIILQGAPGVGKTFAAQRLAFSIMGVKDTSRVKVVQFHQSYSYEDFVMGYRPDGVSFRLAEGPFYKFCKSAEGDDIRPYFFIIDEINRGNLSKIFGELLMLIETDKRGEKNSLRLLYKDEQFFVPANVHIIGMMNTADRSLAMIDYALRRRFAFFEMEPAFLSDGFKSRQAAIQNAKFDALVSIVELLNKAITDDASLGAGFRVGHSYFCMSELVDDAWLSSVVEYELIPLLLEYWFDEPSKVESWSAQLRGAIRG
jgi:5-methylcytosine-specific restriction protein B